MRIFRGVLVLATGLCLTAPAGATINYNASKSNTGNVAARCHEGRGHMAVKGCGVPQNTSGMASGRRVHKPLQ